MVKQHHACTHCIVHGSSPFWHNSPSPSNGTRYITSVKARKHRLVGVVLIYKQLVIVFLAFWLTVSIKVLLLTTNWSFTLFSHYSSLLHYFFNIFHSCKYLLWYFDLNNVISIMFYIDYCIITFTLSQKLSIPHDNVSHSYEVQIQVAYTTILI